MAGRILGGRVTPPNFPKNKKGKKYCVKMRSCGHYTHHIHDYAEKYTIWLSETLDKKYCKAYNTNSGSVSYTEYSGFIREQMFCMATKTNHNAKKSKKRKECAENGSKEVC